MPPQRRNAGFVPPFFLRGWGRPKHESVSQFPANVISTSELTRNDEAASGGPSSASLGTAQLAAVTVPISAFTFMTKVGSTSCTNKGIRKPSNAVSLTAILPPEAAFGGFDGGRVRQFLAA
jgi:hypothetical protein